MNVETDKKWEEFKMDDPITGKITPKEMRTGPEQEADLKSTQFGYPCEFKTPVFMQPFKFYTKHAEGLNIVHGEKKGFELHHRMQVIRTITEGNMLHKESVELKRSRALEIL